MQSRTPSSSVRSSSRSSNQRSNPSTSPDRESPSPAGISGSFLQNQPPTTRSQTAAIVASRFQNRNEEAQNGSDSTNGANRWGSFLQEYQDQVSVGPQFQVEIPAYDPFGWRNRDLEEEERQERRDICLWKPPAERTKLTDKQLEQYIKTAHDCYNCTYEQALGILFIADYEIDLAKEYLSELRNATVIWSPRDRSLFDQAFTFNGKVFLRIKRMIPDKSVAELVEYYYNVYKKKRPRQTSYVEYQIKKRKVSMKQKQRDSDEDETDSEPPLDECTGCKRPYAQLKETKKGEFCGVCYVHWRATGQMKGTEGLSPRSSTSSDEKSNSRLVKAPSDMQLDVIAFYDELGRSKIEQVRQLRTVEEEISQLRFLTQKNKYDAALIGPSATVREGVRDRLYDITHLKVDKPRIVHTSKWSEFDRLIAVQGFRRYGLDFEAIAEIVGSKTLSQVKVFYEETKEKLDQLIREHENEKREASKGKKTPEVIDLIE